MSAAGPEKEEQSKGSEPEPESTKDPQGKQVGSPTAEKTIDADDKAAKAQ